jgi:hypothetical protein
MGKARLLCRLGGDIQHGGRKIGGQNVTVGADAPSRQKRLITRAGSHVKDAVAGFDTGRSSIMSVTGP